MLRRATALKRICDRQRVQNAGIFVIKRIYKDFIIAFLNSRGEIPFTFLKERLKEETLLNPHSKAISIYFLFSVINMDFANRILSLENFKGMI